MQDKKFLCDYLHQYFDSIEPKEFYRTIFPVGELEEEGKQQQGKYNAIAVELLPQVEDRSNVKRFIINDSMNIMDKLLESNNFIIVSPISYIGKSREANNARYIYSLAIDLDGLEREQNIIDLFFQIENEVLPKPTYTIWSGTGLHLYYQFEQPIPCFKNIVKQLAKLKEGLTKKIWNKYITSLYQKPQLQSLFQGFRLVGGVTKGGSRTQAFITGDKVNIDYLNSFVTDEYTVKDLTYKSKLTLKEAAVKYPEWHEKRIIKKQPKGTWQNKIDLYNWWYNRLKNEITIGHRYYGIMVLAIYAKKCGVDKEKLEADAFGLLDTMEELTTEENNHFKREDILAALEMYNDNYITFPIDSIATLTALQIEKNKRNGRKQVEHLGRIRALQAYDYPNGEWRNKEGRPKKEDIIKQWRKDNPQGTKAECIKETGISKPTVYKWW